MDLSFNCFKKPTKSPIIKNSFYKLDFDSETNSKILFPSSKLNSIKNSLSTHSQKIKKTQFSLQTKLQPRLETDFKNSRVIGVGEFGVVMKATSLIDGKEYAIKVISSKSVKGHPTPFTSEVLNEVKSLSFFTSSCDCRNIIRYYTAWIESRKLYITVTSI